MEFVAGLFDTWGDARQSLLALRQAGFRDVDLSVVGRDGQLHGEEAGVSDEWDLRGSLDGLADLVVGLESVTVPEIGLALAAGPLSATLVGGLLGALGDQGIPAGEILDYGAGVDRGGVLLTVCAPAARAAEARILLRQNGLRDLSEHRRRWEDDPGFRYDSDGARVPPALDAPAPLALVSARSPIRTGAAGTAA